MKPYNLININNLFTVGKIVMVNYINAESHTHFDKQKHSFWELIYVDKGSMDFEVAENDITIKAGEAILYAPETSHQEIPHSTNNAFIVAFEVISDEMKIFDKKLIKLSSKEKQMLRYIGSEATNCLDDLPDDCPCVGQHVKRGVAGYRIQMIKNNMELFLIEIYGRLQGEEKKDALPSNIKNYKNEMAEKIITFLNDNTEKNLTLNEISEKTGVSISQMKRLFKEQYDCGVIDYFINLKIEKAKTLIKETSLNFTQISELLSFNSVHYFSKAFKKRTEMTPSQYSKTVG